MVEVRDDEEQDATPAKRKPDLSVLGKDKNDGDDEMTKKKQKLQTSGDNGSSVTADRKVEGEDEEDEDYEAEYDDDEDDVDDNEEEDEEEEEEEEDGEEDEEGDEHSNGKAAVDRKGKGILREDKGKGKLIEESDDSSDYDYGGAESDGDSDLSDDPLAEVDLDNILPSRTRRRHPLPGVHIANRPGNNDDTNDRDA